MRFNKKNKIMDCIFGFPAPKFLRMPFVGITISDHSIKVMEFLNKENHYALGRYDDIPIERDIVVSGKVVKENALTDILSLIKERYKIDLIKATMPEEIAYLFKIELPAAAMENLYSAIEFKMEEYVPISASEAIFDYEIIKNINNFGKVEVNVSAISEEFVERYLSIFHNAGMIPISLEIEAQAMKRAIVPKNDKGIYMLIDIGRTRTGLAIVSEGTLRYTSTLTIGGDAFVEATQKHLSLSFAEADKIKQEIGFIEVSEYKGLYEALVITGSALEEEIKKRISYWNEHTDSGGRQRSPIQKIILCGGNASMPGFREYLSFRIKMPVELANVWANAFSFDDYIPDIDFKHSLGYASVIGLALNKED